MNLELPINHSCNIKCPNCRHQNLYNFKIEDIEEVNVPKKSQESQIEYKFIKYLICKNPLCNYDIEIKGNILEYPIGTLDKVHITYIK